MKMCDEDIKIARPKGSKIGIDTKSVPDVQEEYDRENANGNLSRARELGVSLAHEVVDKMGTFTMEDEESGNIEMDVQRGLLMTFAATVVLEKMPSSSVVSLAAKNSFNAEIEKLSPVLYGAVGDSGAFSFYYLAYRRGADIERRIGQTFAMLCSHDGDPVYQELGEAIYCWFTSLAGKKFAASGL